MMDRDIDRAVARTSQAAKNERHSSPAAIQNSHAVRHGPSPTRRAKVTQDATAAQSITANLYHEITGIEQTTGDGAGITVYCSITPGSGGLAVAEPRLTKGTDIFVKLLPYGSGDNRWYCTTVFQTVEPCIC